MNDQWLFLEVITTSSKDFGGAGWWGDPHQLHRLYTCNDPQQLLQNLVVITTSPISFFLCPPSQAPQPCSYFRYHQPFLTEVDVQIRASIFFSDFQIFPNVFTEVMVKLKFIYFIMNNFYNKFHVLDCTLRRCCGFPY